MPDNQKVSCLMVTKNRLHFVKRAVKCFQVQTHQDRELVVVNDANDGTREYLESLNDSRIVYIGLSKPKLVLGELRNIAIEGASGDFVVQWDDDDWYHKTRIATQLGALIDAKADIAVLERWTLAWPSRNLYCWSKRRIWEGSMLAIKKRLPSYQSNKRGEDSKLLKQCVREGLRFCLIDRPSLYVYVVHGENTWNERHFLPFFDDFTRQLTRFEIAKVLRNLGVQEVWGRGSHRGPCAAE